MPAKLPIVWWMDASELEDAKTDPLKLQAILELIENHDSTSKDLDKLRKDIEKII